MALINCPDCGKEVSDSAKTCPNCNSNIKEHLATEKWKNRTVKWLPSVIIFIIAYILISIFL